MSLRTDLKSKKIKISITTYPKVGRQYIKPKENERTVKMCDQSCMTNYKDRKFLCTLCLNEQLDENDNKFKNKNIKRLKNNTCPFCHKESKTCIQDASTDTDRKVTSNKNNYHISDMKYLTSIATGTGTYLESAKNNADKKITNINDEFYKHLKQNDESSYLPADFCRKHGTFGDSCVKPAQNTSEKVCKGTKMPLSIEDLNQRREVNLKSTKPFIEAICKAAGSGEIVKDNDTAEKNNISNKHKKIDDDETNVVETQTSKNPMDIKTGLSLLNEVLTVFQNQKHCFYCKDASIQVTDSRNKKLKSLSVSKIIKYSIFEEEIAPDNSKFIILECCQPDGTNKSKSALHLTKHKSSSIPQMKLEELKYAMKEKTKSKDTVDEVNRMFAIVGKYGKESKDNLNRPMIRNGPRILPVVKTPLKNTQEVKDNSSDVSVRNRQLEEIKRFKICQTNDYMSGGDSKESCSNCNEEKRSDKCVYMLSCRHNVPGLRLCDCSKKRNSGCKCQEHYVRVEQSDCSTNF